MLKLMNAIANNNNDTHIINTIDNTIDTTVAAFLRV